MINISNCCIDAPVRASNWYSLVFFKLQDTLVSSSWYVVFPLNQGWVSYTTLLLYIFVTLHNGSSVVQ
jgi:hypothetical protein